MRTVDALESHTFRIKLHVSRDVPTTALKTIIIIIIQIILSFRHYFSSTSTESNGPIKADFSHVYRL